MFIVSRIFLSLTVSAVANYEAGQAPACPVEGSSLRPAQSEFESVCGLLVFIGRENLPFFLFPSFSLNLTMPLLACYKYTYNSPNIYSMIIG